VGAAAILVASILMGWGINPLYRGVFDLSTTATGRAVNNIDDARPGTWVGIGSYETMAMLMESDVHSLSGVQTYPSKAMWKEIDPTSKYAQEWNRLGHVHWSIASGAPTVKNPQPDVISVTIDPCSTFAQKYVNYVLTDGLLSANKCLVQAADVKQGILDMRVYRIVPPA
jgi:hypothetical protein